MTEFVPERFHSVLSAPAWMDTAEKTLLYAFVVARAPARVLEVGALEGGATAVLCAALDDVGHGRLAVVDDDLRVPPGTWAMLEHRAVQADDFEAGLAALGGEVDLVLIGHPTSEHDVSGAVEAVLDHLAPGAHVLVHDVHVDTVAVGVAHVLRDYPDRIQDGGLLATARFEEHRADGGVTTWGGLQLLHHVEP